MVATLRFLWQENSLVNVGYLVLILITGGLLIWGLERYLLRFIHRLMEKKFPEADKYISSIDKLITLLLWLFLINLALQQLYLTDYLKDIISYTILGLIIIFSVLILQKTAFFILSQYFKHRTEDEAHQEKVLSMIWSIAKIFIWLFAFLFFLDNLGIQISGLIAGLGIGGIAIGFASQSIIQDIFSYFTIQIDKPFEIGDFIIVGDFRGVVEYIGIKTTRLQSLSGEQLVFSNGDLTNSRIQNFRRMKRRRIVFNFGVTYDTSLEKLREIPPLITDIIENIDNTEVNRVHFQAYGDFSLIFEVVYFVNSKEYLDYMNIQQEINFKMKKEFKERGIEFAFPSRTIYLKQDKLEVYPRDIES